jgi:hypothetical protein
LKFSDIHNPKAAAEAIRDFQKRFSAKVCLSPSRDCDGPIVSAHTLSVSGMLRPISRDGLVYTVKAGDFYKAGEKSPIAFALKGIKETSVFNGFCAKHDKNLFAPIEDKEFICTKEQCFLHAYRAVTKEAYLKRKQAESLMPLEKFKEIHGIKDEVEYSPEALIKNAASLRGAEEIERLKTRLDSALIYQDFDHLVTTVVPFSSTPTVVTSFVYAPDFDFDGSYLQKFEDFEHDLSSLMVTIFPVAAGGLLLLSHESTANSAPRKLVESYLRQKDLTSCAVWLVACQTENFALSPAWYEGLRDADREAFENAFYSTFRHELNQLKERKLNVNSWGAGRAFTI